MLQREGAETHGTFSQRFRSLNAPSVGLLSTGVFELRTTPACRDSAPPGLATSRAAGPDEPGQSPTRLVSGCTHRLSVLSERCHPAVSRVRPVAFSATVFFSVSTTPRRTGSLDPACLAADKTTSPSPSAQLRSPPLGR